MVSKVIQKRREKLRDFIRYLPDEKLRMDCVSGFLSAEDGAIWGGDERRVPIWPSMNECGSIGCIAGWMGSVFPEKRNDFFQESRYEFGAMGEFLGIADYETLFVPRYWNRKGAYSPQQIHDTLDHLVETGEVRWSK